MSLTTYSGLKSAIADWLDRDDLTSDQVDDLIDICEARNARDIVLTDAGGTRTIPRVQIRETIQRATTTVSARYLALPARHAQMKTFRLLTNPVTVLTEIDLHEMNRRRVATTGKPKFFTVHEEIEFDRSPDSSYTGEMIYYSGLQALSDANTSNALLARAGDLYLWGSLAAAAPFLGEDERVATWDRNYIEAREGLAKADQRARQGTPLQSRVVGATP